MSETARIESDVAPLILAGLEHAWKWVDSWKNRRAQLYNFYLIGLAFLIAGYFAAVGSRQTFGARIISAAGMLAALFCGLVDSRLGRYDAAGEDALVILQARLAAEIGCPELQLVERTRASIDQRPFRFIVVTSFALGAIVWTCAAIYALIRA